MSADFPASGVVSRSSWRRRSWWRAASRRASFERSSPSWSSASSWQPHKTASTSTSTSFVSSNHTQGSLKRTQCALVRSSDGDHLSAVAPSGVVGAHVHVGGGLHASVGICVCDPRLVPPSTRPRTPQLLHPLLLLVSPRLLYSSQQLP